MANAILSPKTNRPSLQKSGSTGNLFKKLRTVIDLKGTLARSRGSTEEKPIISRVYSESSTASTVQSDGNQDDYFDLDKPSAQEEKEAEAIILKERLKRRQRRRDRSSRRHNSSSSSLSSNDLPSGSSTPRRERRLSRHVSQRNLLYNEGSRRNLLRQQGSQSFRQRRDLSGAPKKQEDANSRLSTRKPVSTSEFLGKQGDYSKRDLLNKQESSGSKTQSHSCSRRDMLRKKGSQSGHRGVTVPRSESLRALYASTAEDLADTPANSSPKTSLCLLFETQNTNLDAWAQMLLNMPPKENNATKGGSGCSAA